MVLGSTDVDQSLPVQNLVEFWRACSEEVEIAMAFTSVVCRPLHCFLLGRLETCKAVGA